MPAAEGSEAPSSARACGGALNAAPRCRSPDRVYTDSSAASPPLAPGAGELSICGAAAPPSSPPAGERPAEQGQWCVGEGAGAQAPGGGPSGRSQHKSGRPLPSPRESLCRPVGGARAPTHSLTPQLGAAGPTARAGLRLLPPAPRLRPEPRPRRCARPMGGGSRCLAPPLRPAPSAGTPLSGAPRARARGAGAAGGRWPGTRAVAGRRHGPRRLTSALALTRTRPRPQVTRGGPAAGGRGPQLLAPDRAQPGLPRAPPSRNPQVPSSAP